MAGSAAIEMPPPTRVALRYVSGERAQNCSGIPKNVSVCSPPQRPRYASVKRDWRRVCARRGVRKHEVASQRCALATVTLFPPVEPRGVVMPTASLRCGAQGGRDHFWCVSQPFTLAPQRPPPEHLNQ
jgi:hypothetical protein